MATDQVNLSISCIDLRGLNSLLTSEHLKEDFLPVLRIRDILVRILMRIREAQKHTDPEHWYVYIIFQR
jgi:hypothetical protein